MVLSFTNGNVTTNGTEQTVWNITADKTFRWLVIPKQYGSKRSYFC